MKPTSRPTESDSLLAVAVGGCCATKAQGRRRFAFSRADAAFLRVMSSFLLSGKRDSDCAHCAHCVTRSQEHCQMRRERRLAGPIKRQGHPALFLIAMRLRLLPLGSEFDSGCGCPLGAGILAFSAERETRDGLRGRAEWPAQSRKAS